MGTAKNIIVCADGTGNRGGETPDTNVYRIYKAVDRHFGGNSEISEQIVFYDNGVGTHKNKYLRAIGGAFGFGFERNVCDLYKFLARNYAPGDRVFLFGFSRGASTVRACNGFIHTCGLVRGSRLHNHELDARVDEAFKAYRRQRRDPLLAEGMMADRERSHGVIPIHMIGIWDTVVALGFPTRTDKIGPLSRLLDLFFGMGEKLLDSIWPHSFYYYRLTDNVGHACQALALDDERTAFWPHVWREQGRLPGTVEQVWFAGMHSNVGGGYGRSGMASVALHWMMLRAQQQGLVFEQGAVQRAFADSHAHGRMYDSRDGLAILYRYHPREIEALCRDRVEGNIRIHRSVLERLARRTANYAPGQLPATFDVVESDPEAQPEQRSPGRHPRWQQIRDEIDTWVRRRKLLYDGMLFFLLLLAAAGYGLREVPLQAGDGWGLAATLDFVLPDFFDGLLQTIVIEQPWLFMSLVLFGLFYLRIRKHFHARTVEACERLRSLVINEQEETKESGVQAGADRAGD